MALVREIINLHIFDDFFQNIPPEEMGERDPIISPYYDYRFFTKNLFLFYLTTIMNLVTCAVFFFPLSYFYSY